MACMHNSFYTRRLRTPSVPSTDVLTSAIYAGVGAAIDERKIDGTAKARGSGVWQGGTGWGRGRKSARGRGIASENDSSGLGVT